MLTSYLPLLVYFHRLDELLNIPLNLDRHLLRILQQLDLLQLLLVLLLLVLLLLVLQDQQPIFLARRGCCRVLRCRHLTRSRESGSA